MDLYRQILLDNYKNPQNSIRPQSFTHSGKSENLSCGDEVEFFLDIDKDGKISDIGYEAQGCAVCIASASLLSQEINGKSIVDVTALSEGDLLLLTGALTVSRIKCASVALDAVKTAVVKDK